MALSHRSRLIGLCIAAAAAATAFVSNAVDYVVTFTVSACTYVAGLVLKPLAGILATASAHLRNLPGPAIALISAALYHRRQVKRERPVVRPTFRKCAST